MQKKQQPKPRIVIRIQPCPECQAPLLSRAHQPGCIFYVAPEYRIPMREVKLPHGYHLA